MEILPSDGISLDVSIVYSLMFNMIVNHGIIIIE